MAIRSSRRVLKTPRNTEDAVPWALGRAPIGIYLTDAADRLIRVNQAFSTMLGYSIKQLLKMPLGQVTHREDQEVSTSYRHRLLTREQKAFTFQRRFIHKHGRVVWATVTASLARCPNRDSHCILNFVQQITEGRLAASELRFRRLFEAAQDGIFILDADSSEITDVNPFVETLLGYSRESFLGRSLWDIGLFEHADTREELILGLQKNQRVRYDHLSLLHKSGQPKEVALLGTVYEVDGKAAIQYNLRDMSGNRLSEALRESEERFRVTFDQVAVGIAQIAPDGRLLRINQKYCDIVGYPSEELLERGLEAITNTDDLAMDLEYARRAVAGEIPSYSVDKRHFRKDGTIIWVNVTNKLVHDPSGAPKYFTSVVQDVSVFQDITERKHLEEELLQARKMEAIGRLAGGVAHDFNNFLTVISGYCGMILGQLEPDDPIRHEIGEIKMAGERAAAMTAKLLAFSRRQVAERRVTNLNSVMLDIQELLSRLIGEDIELVAKVEPGLWLVRCDEAQIGQVMMNLAVNARDAMPNGGRLTIIAANVVLDEEYARRHLGVRPGRYVMLSVNDTGCGMDADTQAQMFDPFFTTKGQGKGTGLGLSTVYGIVKEHDGHVDVESAVGIGTTMRVYLPRVEGPVEATSRVSSETQRGPGAETILLVEDDDQLRHLIAQILQAEGYTLLEAENGSQALELSEKQVTPIDLVLTDIVMPGMNGCVLAEKLMSLRVCNAVLFMSGYTGDANVHQAALPADATILAKPFTPGQLLDRVRSVLDRDQTRLNGVAGTRGA